MLALGVANLRRLKALRPIELKPITVLVGRNSSGKSSFLRTIPLLRQSLMTRTSSPILWFGDLVDFGSFDVSVTDNALEDPITFYFSLDKITLDSPPPTFWPTYRNSAPSSFQGIHFEVSIVKAGERTRISRIVVSIGSEDLNYEVLVGDETQIVSIRLNGKEISDLFSPMRFQITSGSIFPDMTVVPVEGTERASTARFPIFGSAHQFTEPIQQFLAPFAKRVKEQHLAATVNELLYIGLINREAILSKYGNDGPQLLQALFRDICGPDKRGVYPRFREMLSLAVLPAVLAAIKQELRAIISSTLYIGPARARSERYYRYQDLAVSEIDPDGKNFPMFLNSLSQYQIAQLSEWIEALFGYGLSVWRQSGGHLSINLVAKGVTSNIVDTGYGVSQILPVLGQIWWARSRPRVRKEAALSLLAIEQPELHLHPAHQALLADALVGELRTGSPRQRQIHF